MKTKPYKCMCTQTVMPKHCHWLSSNKSLCSGLPGEHKRFHINALKRTNEMSGYVCKRLCYCTMKKSLAEIESIYSDAAWLGLY